MGMNVPLRMCVTATWEMCAHIWVSAAHRRRVPHSSPLPVSGGRFTLGWVANGGLLLQLRGSSLPQAVCPSTAQVCQAQQSWQWA